MDDYKRTIWISLGIIGGSFVLFGALAAWLSGDVSAQAQNILETRGLIRSQGRNIALLADFKRTEPQIQAYEGMLQTLLPPRNELLEFSRWLDGLGRVNNVTTIFAFQGAPVIATPTEPGHISFRIDLGGSYEDIRNFLDNLEFKTSRFLISLQSIDLSRSGNEYRGVVLGQTYFLGEAAPPKIVPPEPSHE